MTSEHILILTNIVKSMTKDKNGKFPYGTVNHLVQEKLKRYAELAKNNK